jgi:hypothetical protein
LGVDRHLGGVRRDGDPGCDRVAVRGDDRALRAELEVARAGVDGLAVGGLDLEVALALDREVERVAGVDEVALLVER